MRTVLKVLIILPSVFICWRWVSRYMDAQRVVEEISMPEEAEVEVDSLYVAPPPGFVESVALGAKAAFVGALPTPEGIQKFGKSVGNTVGSAVLYVIDLLKRGVLYLRDLIAGIVVSIIESVADFVGVVLPVIMSSVSPFLPYIGLGLVVWMLLARVVHFISDIFWSIPLLGKALGSVWDGAFGFAVEAQVRS